MSTGNTEEPPGLDGEAPARGEDDPDAWLDDWVARNLAYLSALYPETPWNDAGPDSGKSGSEEKGRAA